MKSILVIDTPKSCSECEFKNCKVRNTIYDRMRAPQCPLRQLPSKEEVKDVFENLLSNGEFLNMIDVQDFPKYNLLNNLINTIYGSDEE